MTDDQMPARPAVAAPDATERPAEGTAQGEAPGGAEGPQAGTDTPTRPHPIVGAEAIHRLLRPGKDCPHCEYVAPGADLAELDQLRGKLRNPVVAAVVQLVEEGQHQYRRAEAAHDLKDEANNRWLAVVAERDGLRGKVEAVRALCDEADRNPRDDWRGDEIWAVDTDKIRAVLDGGEG